MHLLMRMVRYVNHEGLHADLKRGALVAAPPVVQGIPVPRSPVQVAPGTTVGPLPAGIVTVLAFHPIQAFRVRDISSL